MWTPRPGGRQTGKPDWSFDRSWNGSVLFAEARDCEYYHCPVVCQLEQAFSDGATKCLSEPLDNPARLAALVRPVKRHPTEG